MIKANHKSNKFTPKLTWSHHDSKERKMFGQRLTLYPRPTQQSSSLINIQGQSSGESKQSNFQLLKKEIKCLQNSQFLSLKYHAYSESAQVDIPAQFRTTGKEFAPNKKVTQLQKYKLHLKRKGKSRRISLILDNHKFQKYLQGEQYNCLNYLKINDLNSNCRGSQGQMNLKKKTNCNIAKKYYRPMTCSNRSVQQLSLRQNQIRGRKLRSTSQNKKEKENVFIYCC